MSAKDTIDIEKVRHIYPPLEEWSELTLTCRRGNYSAAEVARAVEDCDAHLMNLNVTDRSTDDGDLVIEIRVDHRNGSRVAQSVERYGYSVIGMRQSADDHDQQQAIERINNLIKIISED